MTPRPIRIALVLAFAAIGCNRAPEEPASVRPEPAPASSPRSVPGKECSRDALTRLISMPEDLPTQKEVLAVCSQPRATLIAIARDQSGRGLARLRAIEMLGALGGPDAVAPLADLSLATTDLASVRRASLVALGRVTQPDDGERARVGASALGDSDPHVRRAAALLLRGSKSPATRQALERAFAAEKVPFVRDAIDQSRSGAN